MGKRLLLKCDNCDQNAGTWIKRDDQGREYQEYKGQCEDCEQICKVVPTWYVNAEGVKQEVVMKTKNGEVIPFHYGERFYKCWTCKEFNVCSDCFLYQYDTFRGVECSLCWFGSKNGSKKVSRNHMVCFCCGACPTDNEIETIKTKKTQQLCRCFGCDHFVCEQCSLEGVGKERDEVEFDFTQKKRVCKECFVECVVCKEKWLEWNTEKCSSCKKQICHDCIELITKNEKHHECVELIAPASREVMTYEDLATNPDDVVDNEGYYDDLDGVYDGVGEMGEMGEVVDEEEEGESVNG